MFFYHQSLYLWWKHTEIGLCLCWSRDQQRLQAISHHICAWISLSFRVSQISLMVWWWSSRLRGVFIRVKSHLSILDPQVIYLCPPHCHPIRLCRKYLSLARSANNDKCQRSFISWAVGLLCRSFDLLARSSHSEKLQFRSPDNGYSGCKSPLPCSLTLPTGGASKCGGGILNS